MQIPDIDAIIHTSDFSCIKATSDGQQPAGPPIFGYNSDPAHEDVPFPDYSYWGHEYTRLRGVLFQLPLAAHQHSCIGNTLPPPPCAPPFPSQELAANALLSNPCTHRVLAFLLSGSILFVVDMACLHTNDQELECFADDYFYYWHGWDLQYKWIRELYANTSLVDRWPEAIWRGRVADDDYPERDALR